jgi:orotidine-5'-phosphate decarboxylase
MADGKDRIIVALDVDNAERAVELVTALRDDVGVFKVGLELLMAAGPQVVSQVYAAGAARVFLDAKLHDIPNTVAGAMRGVVRASPWCVTLHATGGSTMLRAAVEMAQAEAERAGTQRPLLLGVTLLTSLSAAVLREELSVNLGTADYVTHLARLAHGAGCDGVIAAPQEIETVRKAVPAPGFLIITPGVRPAGSAVGDQARVMTPGEAVRRGADYLVIGRPITGAQDPVEAARRISAEIESVGR